MRLTICTEESISVYDVLKGLTQSGNPLLKRIKIKNVKNLVDMNPIGSNQSSYLAYSGLNCTNSEGKLTWKKGIVKLIKVEDLGKKKVNEYTIEAHES